MKESSRGQKGAAPPPHVPPHPTAASRCRGGLGPGPQSPHGSPAPPGPTTGEEEATSGPGGSLWPPSPQECRPWVPLDVGPEGQVGGRGCLHSARPWSPTPFWKAPHLSEGLDTRLAWLEEAQEAGCRAGRRPPWKGPQGLATQGGQCQHTWSPHPEHKHTAPRCGASASGAVLGLVHCAEPARPACALWGAECRVDRGQRGAADPSRPGMRGVLWPHPGTCLCP